MRLTILGSCASYADEGRACAGYLVEDDGFSVMLDCGAGSLSNLTRVADPLDLGALFVTHEHPDHLVDLYALQALLRYSPEGPAGPKPVYAPAGLGQRMGCLLNERGRKEFADAFEFLELRPRETVRLPGLEVTPSRVVHVDPTYALTIRGDDAVLCYTSDTAPGVEVLDAARGCDVLLAEATLPAVYRGRVPHMTAGEAGELARDAGAHTLVLTHLWPTQDRAGVFAEASAAFGGRVIVAEELASIDITAR